MTSSYKFIGLMILGIVLANTLSVSKAQDLTEITSPEELLEALNTVPPDTVLNLSAGNYGVLTLDGLQATASEPLVLQSADPSDPARFSGMVLRDVRGLVLKNLVFDYSFGSSDPNHFRPFQILDSQSVLIKGAVFDGDVATGMTPDKNGYPTGFGLGVRNSAGITVEDSEVENFLRGIVVRGSTEVTIKNNDIHSIRSDGMNFAQVTSVLIEGNHIHDFNRSLTSADHADMIQFWTNGTTAPSRDVVIRGNVLNSGDGLYTQSIFMRNELVDTGQAGDEMFYRDVTIEDNVIINAHLHGITVGETDGLIIRNNTVVRNARSERADDNPPLWTPQIRVVEASRDVQIQRNVTSKITGYARQPDWIVRDNLMVQDRGRMEPGFYDLVFMNAREGDPSDLASFAPRPGGPLDGTEIGASLLWASRQ
jgi:parallel beta-helix repeat protein